jgi:hypothetical protein
MSVFDIITVKECDAMDAEPKSPMPTDLNWDELKAVNHDLTWRGRLSPKHNNRARGPNRQRSKFTERP